MKDKQKKILVIRTDRIGDMLVSTPVFKVLRKVYPDAHIAALVNPYTKDILLHNPYIDEIIVDDIKGEHTDFYGFMSLVKVIKEKKFDVAVALFSNFRVGLLTFLARIPKRIAPATKLAQIFYTDRIKQRRSRSVKHEADYNLELLSALGIDDHEKEVGLWFDESSEKSAYNYLKSKELLDASNEKRLIGLHPGCGDSAKNWKPERYAELADRLISDHGHSVILSGGPAERELLTEVTKVMKNKADLFMPDNVLDFAALLSKLSVFVSSSTGPMHMAAAVKTPTVSLFCPIRVCTPIRWGPVGNRQHVLIPEVPQCEKCIREQCEHYECMEKISVDSVLACINDLAGQK